MFGYVKPDLPYLYMKDDTLYKALYCGVCKNIGKDLGQIARISLTYDATFLSAVVHNIKGVDVTIKKERCIAHAVVGKPMASRDEITKFCASVNVVLAYYKVKDDIIDENKGRIKLACLNSAFKRANAKYPEISNIVETRYRKLRELEEKKEKSLDAVSDSFGLMLKDLGRLSLGEETDEHTDKFFYFLGKWIYLVDALDDYDEDVKKKRYNPFYFAFDNKRTIGELLKENGREISFIFSDIFVSLKEAEENIKWKFNHDLIKNIVTNGLPKTTMKIMKGKDNDK